MIYHKLKWVLLAPDSVFSFLIETNIKFCDNFLVWVFFIYCRRNCFYQDDRLQSETELTFVSGSFDQLSIWLLFKLFFVRWRFTYIYHLIVIMKNCYQAYTDEKQPWSNVYNGNHRKIAYYQTHEGQRSFPWRE